MRASKLISLLLVLTLVVFLSAGIAQEEGEQSSGSIEVVCEDSFEHDYRVGYYEDTVCKRNCPSGYWRYVYTVWSTEGGVNTAIEEVKWATNDLYYCSLYIKSHTYPSPPFAKMRVHYKVWAIKADVDWMREGTWLFVHGKGGHASGWNRVTNFLEQPPYSVPGNRIKGFEASDNETFLYDWTQDLVNWMDTQGMLSLPDGSVKVVAHSFGGAVTLYLLRATYELQFGDIKGLASKIEGRCKDAFGYGSPNRQACLRISSGLRTLANDSVMRQKWIKAARKIGAVYLYHPAIRGGCGSCVGGWGNTWCAASICALGTVDKFGNNGLWYPVSSLTWDGCKLIYNLYGFGGGNAVSCGGPVGCGWGTGAHDRWVQDDHQRLLMERVDNGDTSTQTEGSYIELFEGYHCHSDYGENTNDAAEVLIARIVANPTPYSYGIPLCGSVYDDNGGPLTDRCPYLVTCNVVVPKDKTLTIEPGVKIYFRPGFKITANGTLKANGNLNNPIYLISEAIPDSGIMLKTSMVLKNGGELRPGE